MAPMLAVTFKLAATKLSYGILLLLLYGVGHCSVIVRAGAESGAALAGTVQTPNIGFEKMICNIVGNPNIRYLILGGPESPGHNTGKSLKALFANGVDAKKRQEEKHIPGSDVFPLVISRA